MTMRTPRHRSLQIGGMAALLLLAACQTPVAPADFSSFGKAASGIAQQSDLAFTESNRITRSVSAERFIQSGKPGLSEDSFELAIKPDVAIQWQDAFRILEEYGDGIARLTDTARGPAMSDALVKLGRELNNKTIGAGISPETGSGFASLGGMIVEAAADREARKIIEQANPSIQTITNAMAGAIGSDDRSGLRGSIWSAWTTSFNEIRSDYATAALAKDIARQRSLMTNYVAALDKRGLQLKALSDLRASILALAAAHQAAAVGNKASMLIAIDQIADRAAETKRLYDAFKAAA